MSINAKHVNRMQGTTDSEPLTDDQVESAIDTPSTENDLNLDPDAKPPAKPPGPPPKSDLEIALETEAINQAQYDLLINPPDYLKNYLKNRTHVDATKPKEEPKEESKEDKSDEQIQKEENEKNKAWGTDASDNYITGYDMSVDYKEKTLQLDPEHIENALCEADLSARYKYDLFKPDQDGRNILSKIASSIPLPSAEFALKLLSKLPIPVGVLAKALALAGPIMKVAAEAAKDGLPEKLTRILADNVKSSLDNFIKKHDKKGGGQFFTKQDCSFF